MSRPRRAHGCDVADCEGDHKAHGLCAVHYGRHRDKGTTELTTTRRLPLIQRFATRIVPDDNGCWNWKATLKQDGYPMFYIGGAKRLYVRAHRWAWEHFVGPIPEGHEIDHRCGNPRCVRPGHLQTLTPAEHRLVTADRKKLRQIIGPDVSLAPDTTHTELERAFGQAHGLPIAPDPALAAEGSPLLPTTATA